MSHVKHIVLDEADTLIEESFWDEVGTELDPPSGCTPFAGFCLLPPALGTSTVDRFLSQLQLKFTSLWLVLNPGQICP